MATRGGEGEDKGDPLYDCAKCEGETRIARRCNQEPYPELVEYREHCRAHRLKDEIAGSTAPDRAGQALQILQRPNPDRELVGLVRRVLEVENGRMHAERDDIAEGFAGFGDRANPLLCPLLRVGAREERWIAAYRRSLATVVGMGGSGVPWVPGGTASQDVRRLQAFGVIRAAISEARGDG